MDPFPVAGFNKLSLAEVQEDDGLLDIAYAQRLVVLIEDEDFTTDPAV